MLFRATIACAVTPGPTSSKLEQSATMPGMMGTGTAAAASTVPAGGCTGGLKWYHGVLMHTGTKARRARQVCSTSLAGGGLAGRGGMGARRRGLRSRIPVVEGAEGEVVEFRGDGGARVVGLDEVVGRACGEGLRVGSGRGMDEQS